MTLLDASLLAACLTLAVLWLRAEWTKQQRMRETTANTLQASAALAQAKTALEQGMVAIDASTAERVEAVARADAAEQQLSSRDQRRAKLALLTDEERGSLVRSRCQNCGGSHPRYGFAAMAPSDQRACPRVSRFRFGPSGNVTEVEFWADWDRSEVIWPDEIAAAGAESEAAGRSEKQKERPLKVITG